MFPVQIISCEYASIGEARYKKYLKKHKCCIPDSGAANSSVCVIVTYVVVVFT